MSIKYVLILLNIGLMFIIMIILYAREKTKMKKLRSEFELLRTSLEKNKEDKEIVNKHTGVYSRCWWNACTVNFGRQFGTFLQI